MLLPSFLAGGAMWVLGVWRTVRVLWVTSLAVRGMWGGGEGVAVAAAAAAAWSVVRACARRAAWSAVVPGGVRMPRWRAMVVVMLLLLLLLLLVAFLLLRMVVVVVLV